VTSKRSVDTGQSQCVGGNCGHDILNTCERNKIATMDKVFIGLSSLD
jgi:hypothetical protein